MVASASICLSRIPCLGEALQHMRAGSLRSSLDVLSIEGFSTLLHRHGINLRHMGFVRRYLKRRLGDAASDAVRQGIRLSLVHAVSRTLKHIGRRIMRRDLRVQHQTLGGISSSMFSMYNGVISMLSLAMAGSEQSKHFWSHSVLPELVQRFPRLLERPERADMRSQPHAFMEREIGTSWRVEILEFVGYMLGITFREGVLEEFATRAQHSLALGDIEQVNACTKRIFLVPRMSTLDSCAS